MKTLLQKLFVFVLLIGFIQACNEPLVEEQTMDDVELKSAQTGKISYIVVLNDDELNSELSNLKGYEKRQQAAQKAAEKVMKRAGITDGELGFIYGTALQGFSVKIPPGQLKKLENDPAVKYVKEDQIITLIEPKAKPGDGDLQATATQVTPWGITRVKGGATYSGDKVVWVIDTGIDLDHEDLNVDGSRGWNFISNNSNADDDNGHGSHCAGIIAAIDNAVGVVGVAAGATVIPVKVLDRRGSGSTSGVIAGVDWVAAYGSAGDVANMSLGGGAYAPLDEAVFNASQKGIYFSLAAGNESDDANNHSPARVNGDYIYTISAMDINDNWAYFSNYGTPVDYCEPGYNIYSTYKGGGYTTMSGTSMAAPHMSGILVWGAPDTDGVVNGDPDGNPDPIGVVGSGTPLASFSYIVAGLTVQFTDTSTDSDGTIQSRSWNFGDGTTSTIKDPSHTYTEAGTYNVTLTVTDNDGATGTASQIVTVSGGITNDPPTADFTFTTSDLSANFTDASTDDGTITAWSWNFGDSGTSTAQNPTHTYAAAGTYNVSMTVTDDDGETGTASKSVTVTTSQTSDIVLSATLRKVRGVRYVDFVWSGAAGTQVYIKMNGAIQATVANDGKETINFGRLSGTFVFQVCETDDSACSNEVTLAL